MNIDEFFAILSEMPHEWFLSEGLIRCNFRGLQTCPVCRVAGDAGCWAHTSGTGINLDHNDILNLMSSADFTDEENPTPMRQRMLAACGLN